MRAFFLALGLLFVFTHRLEATEPVVEFHWSLCEADAQTVLKKLALKVKERIERSLSYFDYKTSEEDFFLYSQGAVLRIRKEKEGPSESTVKIKQSPGEEKPSSRLLKCEDDMFIGKVQQSCAYTEASGSFSQGQKDFLDQNHIDVQWDLLVEHGPAKNTKWTLKRADREDLILEEIDLEKGKALLELSYRTVEINAQEEFDNTTRWIKDKHLILCEAQESKTRQVLEFYK